MEKENLEGEGEEGRSEVGVEIGYRVGGVI